MELELAAERLKTGRLTDNKKQLTKEIDNYQNSIKTLTNQLEDAQIK